MPAGGAATPASLGHLCRACDVLLTSVEQPCQCVTTCWVLGVVVPAGALNEQKAYRDPRVVVCKPHVPFCVAFDELYLMCATARTVRHLLASNMTLEAGRSHQTHIPTSDVQRVQTSRCCFSAILMLSASGCGCFTVPCVSVHVASPSGQLLRSTQHGYARSAFKASTSHY